MSTYKVIEKLKDLEQVLQESDLHTILDGFADPNLTMKNLLEISAKSVFLSIEKIRVVFEGFYSSHYKTVAWSGDDEFRLFEKCYEKSLTTLLSQNLDGTIQANLSRALAASASMLKASLEHYLLLINVISQQLEQGAEQDSSLKEISLFFEYSYTLKEVLVKLEAIQSLYSNLCHLMDVSEDDFPLKINMVETGSLLIKLLGESKIIELLLSLIKDYAGVFYKNNTQQGKIESIPRKLETIESAVKLKKILEENGIDTSKMSKNIEECAYTVTEQLSVLLAGERIVRVNGEVISTTEKSVQKQLTAKETYLLEPAKESEGEEPSLGEVTSSDVEIT